MRPASSPGPGRDSLARDSQRPPPRPQDAAAGGEKEEKPHRPTTSAPEQARHGRRRPARVPAPRSARRGAVWEIGSAHQPRASRTNAPAIWGRVRRRRPPADVGPLGPREGVVAE